MKSIVLCASTLLLLMGCATGPKPVQVIQSCPRVPTLELDLPDGALEHDFIGTMQQLLQGSLPLRPSYSLPSRPALPTEPRLNAN